MSDSESLRNPESQFQACLAHLYDYSFLFNHALVMELIPTESGVERVTAFRDLITQTIERMRPASNLPFHSKAARAYNVLTLRYIDQQETEEIIQQLALSRRQYFREHAHALDTLYRMVIETAGLASAEVPEPIQAITLETEIASLNHYADLSQIDLHDLLVGVIGSTQRLAEQHTISVVPPASGEPVMLSLDRTLLRQILLSLLSSLITHTERGSAIQCSCEAGDGWITVGFACTSTQVQASSVQSAMDLSLQTMLKTLNAELSSDTLPSGQIEFRIMLPYKLHTVLIIDDNRDVIELFKRLFANQPYQVVAAYDGVQAVEIVTRHDPDVIILDIMLPRQDGYEILQKLKNHPQTAHIPILVCSILEAPGLAVSLGAEGYMKKPPERTELLAILDRMLA